MKQLALHVLLALAIGVVPRAVAAQSTSATVFGTVSDEQRGVLPGVTVTLRHLDTAESRTATTDARGAFRVIGLAPGGYELRATLQPFADIQSNVVLALNDEIAVALTMRLGAVIDRVTVAADVPIGGVPLTTMGRAFTTAEIEELPVNERDVVSLTSLAQGIGAMAGTMRTTAVGITSAGQNGRNNTFLV